jgi:micrococcal nuclease
MKIVILTVIGLFLIFSIAVHAGIRFVGRLHHWSDGDTVDVQYHDLEIRLRLQGIDTPERGQEWWKRARKELRALTDGVDLTVSIAGWERKCGSGAEKIGTRHEAVLYLPDGRSVNEILVNEGYARAWCQEPWENLRKTYIPLQDEAMRLKKGMWADATFSFACTLEEIQCK